MMRRCARVLVVPAVAALLLSTGGCVLQSTHNEALAKLAATEVELQQTQTDLQATQMAKADIEGRYTVSQAENVRLKSGVETLSSGLSATATMVQAVDASVTQINTTGADVSTRLASLQQIVSAQMTTIAALTQAMGPLKSDMNALQAKLLALTGGPARAAPVAAMPLAAGGSGAYRPVGQ